MSSLSSGFDATVQAADEIITAGRVPERASLETYARRIRQGAASGGIDPRAATTDS